VIISGTAIVLRGHDIDTDRIIPARYLKAITFDGLEAHVFTDDRAEARARGAVHPFDAADRAGASVLLVGVNFGCGSSREHAPQALQRRGIRAIIGQSFGEIFLGNALSIGLPCVTIAADDLEQLVAATENPDAAIDLDLQALRARAGGVDVKVTMPSSARHAMLTGEWDATGLLLAHFSEVEAKAAALPYIRGFDT
jgi:3-isopropylmalate/(R)-2-methylmalate dehydratase small subunit